MNSILRYWYFALVTYSFLGGVLTFQISSQQRTKPGLDLQARIPTAKCLDPCYFSRSRSRTTLALSNRNNQGAKSLPFYQYKDDCFGFLCFLCGGAVGDVVFTGVFVTLTLMGAAATRLKILPRDRKRPSIVDRKVPAVIVVITLLLSSPECAEWILRVVGSIMADVNDLPDPDPLARPIQLAVGGFSVVTGIFDIRWRDRFDYPQEFLNK